MAGQNGQQTAVPPAPTDWDAMFDSGVERIKEQRQQQQAQLQHEQGAASQASAVGEEQGIRLKFLKAYDIAFGDYSVLDRNTPEGKAKSTELLDAMSRALEGYSLGKAGYRGSQKPSVLARGVSGKDILDQYGADATDDAGGKLDPKRHYNILSRSDGSTEYMLGVEPRPNQIMQLAAAKKIAADPGADPYVRSAAQNIVQKAALQAIPSTHWIVGQDQDGNQTVAALPSKGGVGSGGGSGSPTNPPSRINLGTITPKRAAEVDAQRKSVEDAESTVRMMEADAASPNGANDLDLLWNHLRGTASQTKGARITKDTIAKAVEARPAGQAFGVAWHRMTDGTFLSLEQRANFIALARRRAAEVKRKLADLGTPSAPGAASKGALPPGWEPAPKQP